MKKRINSIFKKIKNAITAKTNKLSKLIIGLFCSVTLGVFAFVYHYIFNLDSVLTNVAEIDTNVGSEEVSNVKIITNKKTKLPKVGLVRYKKIKRAKIARTELNDVKESESILNEQDTSIFTENSRLIKEHNNLYSSFSGSTNNTEQGSFYSFLLLNIDLDHVSLSLSTLVFLQYAFEINNSVKGGQPALDYINYIFTNASIFDSISEVYNLHKNDFAANVFDSNFFSNLLGSPSSNNPPRILQIVDQQQDLFSQSNNVNNAPEGNFFYNNRVVIVLALFSVLGVVFATNVDLETIKNEVSKIKI